MTSACVRGGVGPRRKSGHCMCEACKAHYSASAKKRAALPKRMSVCKNGNVAARGKWGHCLCEPCVTQRRAMAKGSSQKWNDANREKRRAIERDWRLRNPDKVARYSKDAGAKWAANNKGKRLATVRARQIAKTDRTPAWADLERIRLIYEEAERVTRETGIQHEVDHIIPLQGELVSGLHVHDNLRIVTRRENRSKKNHWDGWT